MPKRTPGKVTHNVQISSIQQRLDSLEAIVEELRDRAAKNGWFPTVAHAPAAPAVPEGGE